jgi:hypothetical protein
MLLAWIHRSCSVLLSKSPKYNPLNTGEEMGGWMPYTTASTKILLKPALST